VAGDSGGEERAVKTRQDFAIAIAAR
jgi:hypothetical protein